MMKEGYSGARTISNKFFEFAWGWQVTNPEIMRDWMWNEVTDIYFHDKYGIGVTRWFQDQRHAPAMINMASIQLTAADKGFWKASPDTIRGLADTLGRLVVRYGPSCSAFSCGNYNTISFSREWMSPALAASYSRAMRAALSGNGYAGTPPSFAPNGSRGGKTGAKRPLFDFTADQLPKALSSADFVTAVFRRIRNQDWSVVLLYLLLVLVPSGLTIFVVRDRLYRGRGSECIQLTLRS
jgi:cobaltochelatase CobN